MPAISKVHMAASLITVEEISRSEVRRQSLLSHLATVKLGNRETLLHQPGTEVANWRDAIVNTKHAHMISGDDTVETQRVALHCPKAILLLSVHQGQLTR